MKVGRFATQHSLIAVLVLMGLCPSQALAQHDDTHSLTSQYHDTDQKRNRSALIKAVQDATDQFQDPKAAEGQGYLLQFGCVSGGEFGAMGLHYVNGGLVDGKIDVRYPEIVIYEPTPSGRLRITGADYLVTKEAWEADPKHTAPPELMGQLFHLFDSPNRFGLPPFYTLHVWAWKENPNGAFVNWHPNVSCEEFNPRRK
jgi:hypothetical protein